MIMGALCFFKKRIFLTLILCLLSTSLQYFVYKIYVNKRNFEGDYNKSYPIIFASKEIKRGTNIDESNTKIIYIRSQGSLDNFVTSDQFEQFASKQLLVDIPEKSPLLKDFFMQSDGSVAPNHIPIGRRLFGVEVESSPLNELVQVGDRVDVLAHVKIDGFGDATETILSGIKIVSVQNQSVFNFYLTPEEVKIISFMKPHARFLVSLRNPDDTNLADVPPMTFNQFIQNEKIQKIINNNAFRIVGGQRGASP